MVGKVLPSRPDFREVTKASFRDQLRLVFSPAKTYDVSFPLHLTLTPHASPTEVHPFGTIHIGVQIVFLKSEVSTHLMKSLWISAASIFISLLLAAGISNLALGPLKEISRNLDSVSAGDAEAISR